MGRSGRPAVKGGPWARLRARPTSRRRAHAGPGRRTRGRGPHEGRRGRGARCCTATGPHAAQRQGTRREVPSSPASPSWWLRERGPTWAQRAPNPVLHLLCPGALLTWGSDCPTRLACRWGAFLSAAPPLWGFHTLGTQISRCSPQDPEPIKLFTLAEVSVLTLPLLVPPVKAV